jgi:hypothetical protein
MQHVCENTYGKKACVLGTFSEVKLFQVKPEKTAAFETLVATVQAAQKARPGCLDIKYMKRFYVFDDINEPPRQLTKIVKCVKYFSYWQFQSMEEYACSTKWFFDRFGKEIMKLLIMPFDINCGETLDG